MLADQPNFARAAVLGQQHIERHRLAQLGNRNVMSGKIVAAA
jgi:hypothetical protein